jgi:hypothetical protein
MIADLKADSERWEAERRATASRGQPSNGISLRDSDGIVRKSNTPIVEYRASTTHQSRQYYGPTEAAPAAMQQYAATAATGNQQGVYDNGGTQYQQQSSYAQPATGYSQPQGYAVQDNYYVAGADMAIDQSRPRIPVTQAGTVPRSNVQYSATPTYQQDSRSNTYYSPQPGPVVSSTQYPTQPTDPYYGRGAYNHQPCPQFLFRKWEVSNSLAVPVTGTYDPQDPYVDNRQYQDTGSYSQAPLSSASSATATSGSQTSGTRDRERDRTDRERHHGRSRR